MIYYITNVKTWNSSRKINPGFPGLDRGLSKMHCITNMVLSYNQHSVLIDRETTPII